MSLTLTVADLLRDSHRAHDLAKRHRREGRADDNRQWLTEAQRTRDLAHALDPSHADQAWLAEASKGFSHDDMSAFYAKELGKDADAQRMQAQMRFTRAPEALNALKTQHAEALESAKTGQKMAPVYQAETRSTVLKTADVKT